MKKLSTTLLLLCATCIPAFASVTITSPTVGSTNVQAVTIAASAKESVPFHLELWDTGHKIGDVFAPSVNSTYTMALGQHDLTILAVTSAGAVLDKSSVSYTVAIPPSPPPPPSDVVTITSPLADSTSISAVSIAASATGSNPFHLRVSDNGFKLGDVAASSLSGVYVLPIGTHTLVVEAVDDASGAVVNSSSVNYTVAEDCSAAGSEPCDLDQLAIDNIQNLCKPISETRWLANGCGGGIQGNNGAFPLSTLIEHITENGTLPDQGNHTLNGVSAHFSETQALAWSNVLFRGTSTASTGNVVDNHWTMDEYVYLPNPQDHQAFEVDAQYTGGGIWSKFYTECAFNHYKGTGFWGVFDSNTGGWIFLDGQVHNGQQTPLVPCDRAQFSQPWPGSADPTFTGWHHIVWTFLRRPDGTVTFQTLTFDAKTTDVNFTPVSGSGGNVGDHGNFGALVQLDGMYNGSGQHPIVDAYVTELHLTHKP